MTSVSWKILPPRWSKPFRETQDNLDLMLNFGKQQVEKAKSKFASNPESHEMSVLQKMILRNGPESTYPLVMAIDMIFAGIDTTGNTLSFLMYNLATNPDKQEKLRKECQKFGKNLTVKDLNEVRYLKACIQETLRLTPTIMLNLRIIAEDMQLHGYLIPKGTLVTWNYMLFQETFKDYDKFIPERWIENKKEICPHAARQFSHGPRMCIGKRFAELEFLLAMHKMVTNFEIEWVNPEPLTLSQVFVNVPDQRMDFRFKDLK